MDSTKVKASLIVVALLCCTGLFAVGCKGKEKSAWVNTKSMPGHTFKSDNINKAGSRKHNPNIIYLGSSSDAETIRFSRNGTIDLGTTR